MTNTEMQPERTQSTQRRAEKMRGLLLLVLVIACIAAGCASSKTSARQTAAPIPATQPDSPPLISIVVLSGGYVREEPMEYVIFAAWKDGRVIWSGDPTRGGAPLYKAKLPAGQFAILINKLDQLATKANSLPLRHSVGPDSAYTQIRYRNGANDFQLDSWHEISELNPKLVASSLGIEALHGRKREDVLAASSEPYRQFRQLWQELRESIRQILPASGEKVEGAPISHPGAWFKARRAAEEIAPDRDVSAGIRVPGGWKFMAYPPDEAAVGGHFFVLVFDDGTVELESSR
jgi:hypothetical protein